MSLEQYKTQVLLLHSQQSTLDKLSAGFTDKYAVHCATSGTEALTTLGDTPIHVIVSAQELPGMSGLEALREAKKRSPDTIGILLAGTDKQDGLEALVGDQEVFEIVRGAVTPDALIELIESANQRVRLMALAESANDTKANVDEPVAEHIVMETSENGSTIISDGTGTMPALKPGKIDFTPGVGGRDVDVLVLTKDEEFLGTIRDSARGLHNVYHAITPTQAEEIVQKNKVGVLVTDAAMVGSKVEALSQRLRKNSPRIVAIVAGRRDDGELLMDLINRGHVYRFLLKPVSPGRSRLAIEASVKHHMEAPDEAFKPKSQNSPPAVPRPDQVAKAAQRPPATPKTAANPAAKPAAAPQITGKPAPAANAAAKPAATPVPAPKPAAKPASTAKAAPGPTSAPQAAPQPMARKVPPPQKSTHSNTPQQKIEPTISAAAVELPIDDGLDQAFGETNSFTETMTGIAASVGKSFSAAGDSVSGGAAGMLDSVGDMSSGAKNPKVLAIAGVSVVAVAITLWTVFGGESEPENIVANEVILPAASTPAESSSVESRALSPTPATDAPDTRLPPAAVGDAAIADLLDKARSARAAGDLINPPGNSAVDYYLAVAAQANGDPAVAAELDDVVSEVLGVAESAILSRDAAEAETALGMARLADPDNSRLAFLAAQVNELVFRDRSDQARLAIRDGRFEDAGNLIGEARSLAGSDATEISLLTAELSSARAQQEVSATIALANERLDAGNLVAPANDNARYYFQSVLASDPNNQAAQQGLITVASKLVLQARAAIDTGELDNAQALLNSAGALDPASAELSAATDALTAARAAIADQAQQAELAQQAEAARQAEAVRQAELARQAEAERQAELARQAEADRLAALQQQADAERRAALERQAEADRLAEEARLTEEQRQAELEREAAEQIVADRRQAEAAAAALQAAESRANDVATASPLGVGAAAAPRRSAAATAKPASSNRAAASVAPKPAPTASNSSAAAGASTFGIAGTGTTVAGTQSAQPAVAVPETAPDNRPIQTNAATAGSSAPKEPEIVPISQLTRTNYVGPEYPRAARRRGVTGSVDLTFTVGANGIVSGIEISRSDPAEIFDQAAMDAVQQWRFAPVIESGEAVAKRSAVRLSFDLQ